MRASRHDGYIFGVGLSRTGTRSLSVALGMLGYPCRHYPDPGLMLAERYEEAFGGLRAACDISVSVFMRELDERYPGALFVLTVRPLDAWLPSIRAHTERIIRDAPEELQADNPKGIVRARCFGTAGWETGLFVETHRRHREAVEAYFADRPGRLLVLDVTSGAGWPALCGFLGVDEPDEPFPHQNRRAPLV